MRNLTSITGKNHTLPTSSKIANMADVVAKSTASRGKLNIQKANTSTPILHRAIFVRSTRTPKENNQTKIGSVVLLSMVGREGQRLDVGCFPFEAVFHPFTSYRQTVESLAVNSEIYQKEFTRMNTLTPTLDLNHELNLISYALLQAQRMASNPPLNLPQIARQLTSVATLAEHLSEQVQAQAKGGENE